MRKPKIIRQSVQITHREFKNANILIEAAQQRAMGTAKELNYPEDS